MEKVNSRKWDGEVNLLPAKHVTTGYKWISGDGYASKIINVEKTDNEVILYLQPTRYGAAVRDIHYSPDDEVKVAWGKERKYDKN